MSYKHFAFNLDKSCVFWVILFLEDGRVSPEGTRPGGGPLQGGVLPLLQVVARRDGVAGQPEGQGVVPEVVVARRGWPRGVCPPGAPRMLSPTSPPPGGLVLWGTCR